MASKAPKQEDNGPDTPARIVSFTDMITLLLAFFVLLQAFAKEQDPELYRQGQGAFKRSIAGFGIPNLLFGQPKLISGVQSKKRHPTEENDDREKTRRNIDLKNARIKQAFEKLADAVDTVTCDKRPEASNVESAPISFAPASAALGAEARQWIGQYAARLGRNRKPARVVVVASAPDIPVGKARWILSTNRARAVCELMGGVLSDVSQGRWILTPMGSGAAGPGDPRRSAPARQEFVRIAIIETE